MSSFAEYYTQLTKNDKNFFLTSLEIRSRPEGFPWSYIDGSALLIDLSGVVVL